jgi:hypothetical protein
MIATAAVKTAAAAAVAATAPGLSLIRDNRKTHQNPGQE